MKKLLLLGALALVASSAYADTIEAGTEDAPKYYTIKASRGNYRYLAYSPNGITLTTTIPSEEEGGEATQVQCSTHLLRQAEIDSYAVWAVTPGSAEGTFVIKNVNADEYLMGFQTNAGVVSNAPGGFAITTSTPTDLYLKDNGDGTFMPSLYNANGFSYNPDVAGNFDYNGLDATGGDDTRYCGNYWSGDGVKWTFTEYEEAQTAVDEAANSVATALEPYIANIPAEVAAILQKAIDDAKTLKYSATLTEQAEAISTKAIADANALLENGLSNTQLSLKNLRQSRFISVSAGNWVYSDENNIVETNFTFKPHADGGYILYNEAAKVYVGPAEQVGSEKNVTVVTDEAEAIAIYPALFKNGDYYGVALALSSNPEQNTQALNTNNNACILHTYYANDGGSIFALVPITVTIPEVLAGIVDGVTSELEPYVPNVPAEVAAVLETAINEVKQLEYSSDVASQAETIRTKAKDDANALLGTCADGKIYTLKNLRRAANASISKVYIAVNPAGDNYLPVVSMADLNALFTMKSAGDGCYVLYNDNTKTYIGDALTQVADEASAKKVYPVLNTNSGFSGVAFPFAKGTTGDGFNENTVADGGELTSYNINDGGSIWALNEFDAQGALDDAISGVVSELEPYIPNVPAEVAAILETAIEDAGKLQYSASLAAEAEAIRTKAIADANALLATGLNNAQYSIKNLRQDKFISVANGEWVYSDENNMAETNYGFIAKDGGYILYNAAAKVYVGQVISYEGGGQTDVDVATAEADALTVYPFLCKGGAYSGVALAIAADPTSSSQALNTNTNATILHTYSAGDAGSIFALVTPDPTTAIDEIAVKEVQIRGIFDLQGRRVNGSAKGLLIVNGKITYRK